MAPPSFVVRSATWEIDSRALQAVRRPVFVIEQKVDPREEFDEIDLVCQHILALDNAEKPIGTGRVDAHGKIGRMAVLPEWRGRNVGQAILMLALELARGNGFKRVYLHAQVSAIGFYAKSGFTGYGEHFFEAGIEHLAMERAL